jgi:hypothetical protein
LPWQLRSSKRTSFFEYNNPTDGIKAAVGLARNAESGYLKTKSGTVASTVVRIKHCVRDEHLGRRKAMRRGQKVIGLCGIAAYIHVMELAWDISNVLGHIARFHRAAVTQNRIGKRPWPM